MREAHRHSALEMVITETAEERVAPQAAPDAGQRPRRQELYHCQEPWHVESIDEYALVAISRECVQDDDLVHHVFVSGSAARACE